MHIDVLFALSLFLAAPFLAIMAILVYYSLRKAAWRHKRRFGRGNLGFYPSCIALGMALQFVQVFYRPDTAYALEARQEEVVDDDDEGDPETLTKQLSRQLKRIRLGEPIERLILGL
jgi:hypothetical protein